MLCQFGAAFVVLLELSAALGSFSCYNPYLRLCYLLNLPCGAGKLLTHILGPELLCLCMSVVPCRVDVVSQM